MKTLTLRIYATVVAVLLLFALASAWVFQRHIDSERGHADQVLSDRMEAWGDLIQRSLPPPDAPLAEQSAALQEWSARLRIPLALDDAQGQRIAVSELFERRMRTGRWVPFRVRLDDGRVLWVVRVGLNRPVLRQAMIEMGETPPPQQPGQHRRPPEAGAIIPWLAGPDAPAWQRGVSLLVVLMLLLVAVAAGTWPVVRALTRRLNVLKQGAERFGAGELSHRVVIKGHDEVAAVARTFNEAAARIEKLVRSHQSLLANASHELRSPLARMKMAVSLWDDAPPARREALKHEIHTNIAELDVLVEEVLLASRLDTVDQVLTDLVDLQAVLVEELARLADAQCTLQSPPGQLHVLGNERLLRRALRNLLENAFRYGGPRIDVEVRSTATEFEVWVCDRGDGVPLAQRERIFEAFYRLPGHAEKAGGVGLGLSLVKQIATHHQGRVHCEGREGGGSCFVLSLPRAQV